MSGFEPIRTERLTIRAMTPDDAGDLWERRNDPEVARYQDWATPYPRSEADRVTAELTEMDGPTDGEWWMAAIELEDRSTAGDLVVHLSSQGRTAEIGYTLDRVHWGHGYAVEALGALVDYLFETVGVTRIFGMMHPDNRASARVLERCGFLFEGHTRKSYWLNDENSDDWIYGLLREDREAWRNRPLQRPGHVRLVEPTAEHVRELLALRTHKSQEAFVAPMAKSLSQALLPEVWQGNQTIPWYRAIEADGEIVGFAMLATYEGDAETILWRLLIDRLHQRRGVASMAMDLVEAHVRDEMGESTLMTSWVPGRGSPEAFYLGRGYEPTGEMEEGEVLARKVL
jgi:RimJ/RimL family protein N-acetyltransferase